MGIDVYVVNSDLTAGERHRHFVPQLHSSWQQHLSATAIVILVSTLCYFAGAIIDYRSVGMFLLFTVSLLALFVDRGPILISAALSATIWNFFFIPPRFTFHIDSFSDILMVLMYFLIALVGGTLTGRVRAREITVRRREGQTTALYHLAEEINHAKNLDEILHAAQRRTSDTFKVQVAFFLPEGMETISRMPHPASISTPSPQKEWSVALWVFQNRKPAGRGTQTLPFADGTYFPLLTTNGAVGVIGIHSTEERQLTLEQEGLLQTFLHQIAIAIEREILRSTAEQARLLSESERLHRTLLNSISHELRTPLATITGASSSLIESKTAANASMRSLLSGDIYAAAQRLNRLVKNLLDMTRLESGMLKLNLEWCDAADLISVVIRNLKAEMAFHHTKIETASDLPLVRIDFVLMEQALANLLLNAAQYSPAGTTITLRADANEKQMIDQN